MATIIQLSKNFIEESSHSYDVTNRTWEHQIPERKRRAAEPIKDADTIRRVCEYLVANGRYRDNLLFTAGINLGFRCVDLLQLKWGHLITEEGKLRTSITLYENKSGRHRTAYPNEAVWAAMCLYAEQLQKLHGGIDLDLFVFRSESNRCTANKPLSVRSVEKILKDIVNEEFGATIRISTASLRKTFGYHFIMKAKNRFRALSLLADDFGSRSIPELLSYIGLTYDELEEVK